MNAMKITILVALCGCAAGDEHEGTTTQTTTLDEVACTGAGSDGWTYSGDVGPLLDATDGESSMHCTAAKAIAQSQLDACKAQATCADGSSRTWRSETDPWDAATCLIWIDVDLETLASGPVSGSFSAAVHVWFDEYGSCSSSSGSGSGSSAPPPVVDSGAGSGSEDSGAGSGSGSSAPPP